MAFRDRGMQRRQMARISGTALEEPAESATMVEPLAMIIGGPPTDRLVIADRPRTTLSRDVVDLKHKLHDRMIREIDPARLADGLEPDDAKRAVGDAVLQLLALEGASISRTDELTLMREIA